MVRSRVCAVCWAVVVQHEHVDARADHALSTLLPPAACWAVAQGTRWCSTGMWMRALARWQLARRGRTLKSFLTLGAPGCLAAALESAGWEVTTAMAAYLGVIQVCAPFLLLSPFSQA